MTCWIIYLICANNLRIPFVEYDIICNSTPSYSSLLMVVNIKSMKENSLPYLLPKARALSHSLCKQSQDKLSFHTPSACWFMIFIQWGQVKCSIILSNTYQLNKGIHSMTANTGDVTSSWDVPNLVHEKGQMKVSPRCHLLQASCYRFRWKLFSVHPPNAGLLKLVPIVTQLENGNLCSAQGWHVRPE